jgi:hypothetical protein
MGAHIGPKRDLHLYDVPRPELVQQVTGIRPERPAGHALLKDAGFTRPFSLSCSPIQAAGWSPVFGRVS